MKLSDCRLLADENVHSDVVAFLRSEGVDVRAVREDGLSGKSDRVLLHMAVDENRVVLTHDSDFGTLAIRQGHPVVGVFYVRPGHFPAERTIETLRSVLAINV